MTFPFLDIVASVCHRQGVIPYVVGGPVRDWLLDRPTHDWDIVCPHAEVVAREVAKKLSKKLITLDKDHQIYRVIHSSFTLDIAEQQGKTIQQDLARRDFTINAMASPLALDPLIDPFQGERDLRKKTLRAISRKAFQEDPLRLLRAYRFAAQLNFTIEPQTARWIAAESFRIGTGILGRKGRGAQRPTAPGPIRAVARERIREELLKLLSQRSSSPALKAMDQSGVLTAIFPDLEAGRRVGLAYYGTGGVIKHHLQSVEHLEWILNRLTKAQLQKTPLGVGFISESLVLEQVVDYTSQSLGGFPRSALLKLGTLLHDIGKPATAQVLKGRLRFFGHEDVGAGIVKKIMEKLRFSHQEGVLVRTWVQNHMRLGNLASVPKLTDKAMARFFRDLGEHGIGMVLVSLGDHYTYLAKSQWGKGKDSVEKTAHRLLVGYYTQRETVLPPKVVDGHLLMRKLHLKPGPLIGQLLEAVRDAQAEAKVHTSEEAVAFARRFLRLHKNKK